MWFALCISLVVNAVVVVLYLRRGDALREYKATGIINHALIGELERKYGPRKAARLLRSMTNTIRQTMATQGA